MTDNHNQLRDQYRQAPYLRSPEALDNKILREAAGRANVVNARKADKLNKKRQKQSTIRGLGMAFSCLLCVGLGFMLIREPDTEIVMPVPPLADISATSESSQTMVSPPLVISPPSAAPDQVATGAPNGTGITAEMSVDSLVAESATVSARESAADNYGFDSDAGNAVAINDSIATSSGVERRSEQVASELPTAVVAEAELAEEEIAKKVTEPRVAKEELGKELIATDSSPQVQILEEQVVQVKPSQAPPAVPDARASELASRRAPTRSKSDQSPSGDSSGTSISQIAESQIVVSENSADERASIQAERVDAGVSANNRILAGKSLNTRAIDLPSAVRMVSVAELLQLPQDNYTIIIAESDDFQALQRMINMTAVDTDMPSMRLVNMAGTDNPPRWLLLYGSYESLQIASEGVRNVRGKFSLNEDTAIKARLSIQQYSTLR